jgi:hypothetical protein
MATYFLCRTCGKTGEEHFYKTAKYQCKGCWNERTAQSGKDQVKQLKEEFGGKCSKCGYDKCMDALQFHHVDPSKKEFNLGNKRGYKIETLRTELKKCILVCSNCHIEIHHQMNKEK